MRNVKRHTPCSPRKVGKAIRIFPACPVTVKTPWSEGGPQFPPKGWLGRGERKVCYVCHSRQKRDARDSGAHAPGPGAAQRAGQPGAVCAWRTAGRKTARLLSGTTCGWERSHQLPTSPQTHLSLGGAAGRAEAHGRSAAGEDASAKITPQERRVSGASGDRAGWRCPWLVRVEPRPRPRSRNVRSLLANPGLVRVRYLCVSVLDKLWAIVLR